MINIGKRIKYLRKSASMTQAVLGSIVGSDGSTISRIEHNELIPNGILVLKLADCFHVSCDFILDRDLDNIKLSIDYILCSSEGKNTVAEKENKDACILEMHQLYTSFEQLNAQNRMDVLRYIQFRQEIQNQTTTVTI